MAASLNLRKFSLAILRTNGFSRDLSTCRVCYAKSKRKFKSKKNSKQSDAQKVYDGPIVVPNKIERSPTAILEALASTVRYDVNQPMYLSIDDPPLVPVNDRMKRSHMAAKASGRAAAQQMLAMYPDYFTQIWQDELPEAQKYDPYQGYEHKEASDAAILERIKNNKVKDAIDIYETSVIEGVELSQKTLEHLLEFLTIHNCDEPEKRTDLENYISPIFYHNTPSAPSKWKPGNTAEQVFNALQKKTPAAYNFMLRGMADSYDDEKAFSLYKEMKATDIPVDTYSYNKLLQLAPKNKQSVEEVIELIETLLKDMNTKNVVPNIETFNSALFSLKSFAKWPRTQNYILGLLSEMKACGIEPQLSTFYCLISIFYYWKDKGVKSPKLLSSIFENMKGKDFDLTSTSDSEFFRTASKSLVAHFPDPNFANTLLEILKTGNNFKAIGNRLISYNFYCDIFSILVPIEHTDDVMKLYHSVVPHIFLPSVPLYIQIIENIKMFDAHHYLPGLYSDIYWAGLLQNELVLNGFLKVMAEKKQEDTLQQQFVDVVSDIINMYKESQADNRKRFDSLRLDKSMISNVIMVYLNADDGDRALQTYSDLQLRKHGIESDVLISLAEYTIAEKDLEMTKTLITNLLEVDNSKVSHVVDKVLFSSNLNLTEQDRNFFETIAQDALQPKKQSKSFHQKKSRRRAY